MKTLFCAHCRHIVAQPIGMEEMGQCYHPDNHRLVTSYVTGNLVSVFTGSQWCRDERATGGGCGPEATRFEPK